MGYDDNHEFGPNRTIMVAATISLFAIVTLIVILHLYARYLLRCQERRRRAYIYRLTIAEPGMSFAEQPKDGLNRSVIASLPIFPLKQSELNPGEPLECAVCLGAVLEDAMVRVLPNCKHLFHAECIDMWLGLHSTCPICRTAAEPQLEPGKSTKENGQESEMVGGSTSRLSSFRWMIGRERSTRIQSCGEDGGGDDLERQ